MTDNEKSLRDAMEFLIVAVLTLTDLQPQLTLEDTRFIEQHLKLAKDALNKVTK